MSLYTKGWIYQGWLVTTVPLLVLATSPGSNFVPLVFALFFIPAGIAFALLRCAECKTSIFRVGPNYFPMYTTWPHRRCRVCGASHRDQ